MISSTGFLLHHLVSNKPLRPSVLTSNLLKYKMINQPPQRLPFINNITKSDWNGSIAHPEKFDICLAEGMGPGLQENVPAGKHVGQNIHYAEYVYGYETSKRVQEATGFKLLNIGTSMHTLSKMFFSLSSY